MSGITYAEPAEYESLFPKFIDNINSQTTVRTVFDLGCNLGAFVKLVNNRIPTLEKVIGFEPDKDNYEFVIHSNLPKLTLHNIGIYYGATECEVLGIGDHNRGGYMVSKINAPHVEVWQKENRIHTYENKKFILDILEKYTEDQSLDLLKIDIEASEYNIFENSSAIKNFQWIIAEFHNHHRDYYAEFIAKTLPEYTIVENSEQHFLLKHR